MPSASQSLPPAATPIPHLTGDELLLQRREEAGDRRWRRGPTIRTLADINRGPAGFPGPGGSGSDSDEPQEYYTGGEKRYISVSLGGLC